MEVWERVYPKQLPVTRAKFEQIPAVKRIVAEAEKLSRQNRPAQAPRRRRKRGFWYRFGRLLDFVAG